MVCFCSNLAMVGVGTPLSSVRASRESPFSNLRFCKGTVREIKAEHTPPHTAADERKRHETVAAEPHQESDMISVFSFGSITFHIAT